MQNRSTTSLLDIYSPEMSTSIDVYQSDMTDNRLTKKDLQQFLTKWKIVSLRDWARAHQTQLLTFFAFLFMNLQIFNVLFDQSTANTLGLLFTGLLIIWGILLIAQYMYSRIRTKRAKEQLMRSMNEQYNAAGIQFQDQMNAVQVFLDYKDINPDQAELTTMTFPLENGKFQKPQEDIFELTEGRISQEEFTRLMVELEEQFERSGKRLKRIFFGLLGLLLLAPLMSLISNENAQILVKNFYLILLVVVYLKFYLQLDNINNRKKIFRQVLEPKREDFIARGIDFSLTYSPLDLNRIPYCEIIMWKLYKYYDIQEDAKKQNEISIVIDEEKEIEMTNKFIK